LEAGTEAPEEQNERNSHMHSGLQQGNKFQGGNLLRHLHVPKTPCGSSMPLEVVSNTSKALSDSCDAEIY
jgi:hypothetical protein